MPFINLFAFLSFFLSFCDVPERYQMTIQDPATDVLEWMIDLYDLICFELIVIVSIIFVLLLSILYHPIHLDDESHYSKRSFSHSTELEVFWTIVPAILLITIAYPSFNLLYALDEDFDYTDLIIKIIGHQWYWTYEYHYKSDDFKFDSYMLNEISNPKPILCYLGQEYGSIRHYSYHRLLEVDNRLYLPTFSKVYLLITSADVLHSWTVPSFGIKVDACPGRLTKATLVPKRAGLFFGQCSEICGINHGFMPIVVQVLDSTRYDLVHRYNYAAFIDNFQETTEKFYRPTGEEQRERLRRYRTFGFRYDMQHDTVDGKERKALQMTPEHRKSYYRILELEARKKEILSIDEDDRSAGYQFEIDTIDAELEKLNRDTRELEKKVEEYYKENPRIEALLKRLRKYDNGYEAYEKEKEKERLASLSEEDRAIELLPEFEKKMALIEKKYNKEKLELDARMKKRLEEMHAETQAEIKHDKEYEELEAKLAEIRAKFDEDDEWFSLSTEEQIAWFKERDRD